MYIVSSGAIQIIAASGCISWLVCFALSKSIDDPKFDLFLYPGFWICLWSLFCSLLALAIDRYEDTRNPASVNRSARRPAISGPYFNAFKQAYITAFPTSRRWYKGARTERRIELFAIPLAGAAFYTLPLIALFAAGDADLGGHGLWNITSCVAAIVLLVVFATATRDWRVAYDDAAEAKRLRVRFGLAIFLPVAAALIYLQWPGERVFAFYIVGNEQEQAGLSIDGMPIRKLSIGRPQRRGAMACRMLRGDKPLATIELRRNDHVLWSSTIEWGAYVVNVNSTQSVFVTESNVTSPFAPQGMKVEDGIARLPGSTVLFPSNARLPAQPRPSSNGNQTRFAKLVLWPKSATKVQQAK